MSKAKVSERRRRSRPTGYSAHCASIASFARKSKSNARFYPIPNARQVASAAAYFSPWVELPPSTLCTDLETTNEMQGNVCRSRIQQGKKIMCAPGYDLPHFLLESYLRKMVLSQLRRGVFL